MNKWRTLLFITVIFQRICGVPRPFPRHALERFKSDILKLSTSIGVASFIISDSARGERVCQTPSGRCAPVFAADGPWYNPYNQRIFDTRRNSYLPSHPENYLKKVLGDNKVIVIGEVHSNPCHHRVEFDIIRTLATTVTTPRSIAVGMEAFYRQHQAALDEFVFEHKNFERLKKETAWDETWGYDLNYYSKILRYASANEIRLVGLNIPHPIVRFVSSRGLARIPDNVGKLLPEVDLSESIKLPVSHLTHHLSR
jgi:uncharacterized iron-regulated protein